jgi:pyroglutamyl-peptidase
MKTILITGFEPFGGERRNSSQEIALALHGREFAGRRVVGAVLPCVFGASLVELEKLLQAHAPDLVVCLGVAGGRTDITPERVALNVDDARIPDNAGEQPVDRPVVSGGPAAYWSTLPIKAIVSALVERGISASVSQTAGTFVCNHVFYGLMHQLQQRRGTRGGFIHVPPVSEQAGTESPGLPLETMIDAIAAALEVAATRKHDLRQTGGQVA